MYNKNDRLGIDYEAELGRDNFCIICEEELDAVDVLEGNRVCSDCKDKLDQDI